jgi:bacterioferritin
MAARPFSPLGEWVNAGVAPWSVNCHNFVGSGESLRESPAKTGCGVVARELQSPGHSSASKTKEMAMASTAQSNALPVAKKNPPGTSENALPVAEKATSPDRKTSGRDKSSGNENVLALLRKAYRMELETVTNYLANGVYLDGLRAEEVKSALSKDVPAELGHATKLAQRIKQLGGRVPGSLDLEFDQTELQPPESPVNIRQVVEGVIHAEKTAIAHYRKIIEDVEGEDYVTQDLCIKLLADEEEHRVQFEGFLKELDAE